MRNFKQLLKTINDSIDRLHENESAISAELVVIEQERLQMQAALGRMQLIESDEHRLGPLDCMYCFVLDGSHTIMTQITSDAGPDLLRCPECNREFELPN